MKPLLYAGLFVLAMVVATSGQHPDPHPPPKPGPDVASKCPDKCNCSQTGKCRCADCPTEMSGGLALRAVREYKRLVCFVGVPRRDVPGCLVYAGPVPETNKPPPHGRYIAVLVPDGRGGATRCDFGPAATDDELLRAGQVPRPGKLPAMPKTR